MAWQRRAGLQGPSLSGPVCPCRAAVLSLIPARARSAPYQRARAGGRGRARRGALMAAHPPQMERMAADSGGTARIDPRPAGRTRTLPLFAPGETAAAIRCLPWHRAGVCGASLFLPLAAARTQACQGTGPELPRQGTRPWLRGLWRGAAQAQPRGLAAAVQAWK